MGSPETLPPPPPLKNDALMDHSIPRPNILQTIYSSDANLFFFWRFNVTCTNGVTFGIISVKFDDTLMGWVVGEMYCHEDVAIIKKHGKKNCDKDFSRMNIKL